MCLCIQLEACVRCSLYKKFSFFCFPTAKCLLLLSFSEWMLKEVPDPSNRMFPLENLPWEGPLIHNLLPEDEDLYSPVDGKSMYKQLRQQGLQWHPLTYRLLRQQGPWWKILL